jgi:nicotinamide-nucleotide amidase
LFNIIGDIIVGFDENETIEVVLNRLLIEKKLTVSVAESCTGGLIAEMLTSKAGASTYFKGGMITYATETKINLLNVNPSTIELFSVVSEEVAQEMATGCQTVFKTDFSLATTGNAGPNKGESSQDLGVVCIALATPKGVLSQKFEFGQPREKVITRAANKALEWLYQEILKNY